MTKTINNNAVITDEENQNGVTTTTTTTTEVAAIKEEKIPLVDSTPGSRKLIARSASGFANVDISNNGNNNGIDEAPRSGNSISSKPAELYHHFRSGVVTWFDKFTLLIALVAWYIFGVLAIVTSKMLLQDWNCPPMALTFQQMIFGSIILRMVVLARDGEPQPWPWQIRTTHSKKKNQQITNTSELIPDRLKRTMPWINHTNFVLSGIFNSLDFLCSNYAFAHSAAHFVETIKASDPITTTAIAILFKVDQLGTNEASALSLLVAGVLLSTWGNASDENDDTELSKSIQTATVAMIANICFGFRAMNQKKYRQITNESQQMDDINFLGRICQVGAIFLLPGVFVCNWTHILEAMDTPTDDIYNYLAMSSVNAFAYVTYNLASCYVLSKLTVLHHSSLNCLRRMVVIVATSLFFSKPMSFEATAGLMTSFFGFAAFTYYRSKRVQQTTNNKDSNV